MNSRKKYIIMGGFGLLLVSTTGSCTTGARKRPKEKWNVLFITADDLNCSSLNCFGNPTPDLTPNIDSLGRCGIVFQRAHVASSVSQVSRGALATGLYPHNSGIEGFYHTCKDIPTLQEILLEHGYMTGVLGKADHSTPKADTPWSYRKETIGCGRDYALFVQEIKAFIRKAQQAGKPFYFMANSQDPHRPFEGSLQEKNKWPDHPYPQPSRIYTSSEVEVPGFLPDIPDVRKEITEYTNSVKRLDDFVGALLHMLDDLDLADKTIVIFLSDNGMALPFSKTNCYLHSTRTPLVVRWPGVVLPGTVDADHFVSGIDYLPTILDALGLPVPESLDGRSFLPLLEGKKQKGRDHVYTEFMETSACNRYPIRGIQDGRFGYIFNPWSDGKTVFHNESQSGLTWKAMLRRAEKDPEVARRTRMFSYRTVEEFYDFQNDPDALHNLIGDPFYENEIARFRKLMEKEMRRTDDPILEAFLSRDDSDALLEYMERQRKIAAEHKATKKN